MPARGVWSNTRSRRSTVAFDGFGACGRRPRVRPPLPAAPGGLLVAATGRLEYGTPSLWRRRAWTSRDARALAPPGRRCPHRINTKEGGTESTITQSFHDTGRVHNNGGGLGWTGGRKQLCTAGRSCAAAVASRARGARRANRSTRAGWSPARAPPRVGRGTTPPSPHPPLRDRGAP